MSFPDSIVMEIPTPVAAELSALLRRHGATSREMDDFHRTLAAEVGNAQAQESLFA